jgi:hypothetical protein
MEVNIITIIVFAICVGLPGAAIQYWMGRRQLKRLQSAPLLSAWTELQRELAETLHHPHPEAQEMDKLLVKLQGLTSAGLSEISDPDRSRLRELLRERVDDPKQSKDERLRSEFLLFAMPRAQKQQEEDAK